MQIMRRMDQGLGGKSKLKGKNQKIRDMIWLLMSMIVKKQSQMKKKMKSMRWKMELLVKQLSYSNNNNYNNNNSNSKNRQTLLDKNLWVYNKRQQQELMTMMMMGMMTRKCQALIILVIMQIYKLQVMSKNYLSIFNDISHKKQILILNLNHLFLTMFQLQVKQMHS